MGKHVPFKPDKYCDECRGVGAYDFMGDYLCADCLKEMDAPPESGRAKSKITDTQEQK